MMKRIRFSLLIIILLCLCSTTLSSCTKDEFKDAYALVYMDHVPYLLNKEGKTLSLAKYEAIPTSFDDLMVVARYINRTLKYGFINRSGEEIIKCQYDMAYPFGEGKAVIVKDGIYKIIDQNNKVLYSLPKDIKAYSSFKEGMLKIETTDGFSFLNDKFQKAENSYYSALSYSEGKALVTKNNETKDLAFLDLDFNEVLTNELKDYALGESFSDGLALIKHRETNLYSYIKHDGSILIDENGNSTFLDARSFKSEKAVVFTGKIYYTLYASTGMSVADYYSYQYMNTDGTYYDYYYKEYHNEEINNVLLWGYLNNAYGDTLFTKKFTTGAGKWELYHDAKYEGGDRTIYIDYMDGVIADYSEIEPAGLKNNDATGIDEINVTRIGDENVVHIVLTNGRKAILRTSKDLKIKALNYEYQENPEFMNLYVTYTDDSVSEPVKICNHYLKQIEFTYDFTDLTKLEELYYTMPYDINYVGVSKFYDPNPAVLISVRVSTDKVAIIDKDGHYITKALYDTVIF